MTYVTSDKKHTRVKDIIARYGHCVELVAIDPHFHSISVGLFLKNRIFSVWSYASLPGIEDRMQQIRDRLVAWGEMTASPSVYNQASYRQGKIIERPIKFMFNECVEAALDKPLPSGPISAKDNKTRLTFHVSGEGTDGEHVYVVSAVGDEKRAPMRVKAVVGGYIRYGECKRVAPDRFEFPDGMRHDGLARILLSYAKNVSGTEATLNMQEQQGQMTTQTLGFSQT